MSSTLTIYTSPSCPACTFSKKYMKNNGIDHVVIDVSEDPNALAYIKSLGYSTAPVFTFGEDHWQGVQPSRMDATKQAVAA